MQPLSWSIMEHCYREQKGGLETNLDGFSPGKDIIHKATVWAKSIMKPQRFEHSVRVARTARSLALKLGENAEKAYLAGILHDIARDFEPQELVRVALEEGIILRREDLINPIVCHGKVAAALSKKTLGVEDDDILNAISSHVTGRRGWTRLEQLVYLADKIEPGRDYPGVEKIRELVERQDFYGALWESLADSIIYLVRNKRFLDPETVVVFNEVTQIKQS